MSEQYSDKVSRFISKVEPCAGHAYVQELEEQAVEQVNHPKHYCSHPSGVEVIQITEHMNFCLGNAIKYILRAGLKTKDPIEDLRKAVWYVEREISRLS